MVLHGGGDTGAYTIAPKQRDEVMRMSRVSLTLASRTSCLQCSFDLWQGHVPCNHTGSAISVSSKMTLQSLYLYQNGGEKREGGRGGGESINTVCADHVRGDRNSRPCMAA